MITIDRPFNAIGNSAAMTPVLSQSLTSALNSLYANPLTARLLSKVPGHVVVTTFIEGWTVTVGGTQGPPLSNAIFLSHLTGGSAYKTQLAQHFSSFTPPTTYDPSSTSIVYIVASQVSGMEQDTRLVRGAGGGLVEWSNKRFLFHELAHAATMGNPSNYASFYSNRDDVQLGETIAIALDNVIYRQAFSAGELGPHGGPATPAHTGVKTFDRIAGTPDFAIQSIDGNKAVIIFEEDSQALLRSIFFEDGISPNTTKRGSLNHYVINEITEKSGKFIISEDGQLSTLSAYLLNSDSPSTDAARKVKSIADTVKLLTEFERSNPLDGPAMSADLKAFLQAKPDLKQVTARAHSLVKSTTAGGDEAVGPEIPSSGSDAPATFLALSASRGVSTVLVGGSGFISASPNVNFTNRLDDLKGSSGKDILIGGDGTGPGLRSDERSILDGAEGDDILLAGLSASDVRGGEGNDILIVGGGNAFVDGQGGKDVIALRGEISGAPVQSTVDFTQKIDGYYLIEAGNSNISFKNVEVFIGGEKLTTFKGSHSQRATFIAGEGGGEFHLQRGNTAFGRDDVVDKFYLYTKPPEDVVEEQLRLEYLKFNRVAIGNIGPEDIIYVNGVLFDGARVTSEMAPVLSYDDNGDFGPITSVWLTGESSYGLDFPRAAYLHKPDGWSSYSFQETETYRTVSFARIAATGAEGDRIRFESRQSMGDVSTLASNAEAGVISFRAGSATSWLDPFDGSRSDLSRDPLAADDERLDVVIDGFEEGDAGMTFTSDTLSNGSRYTFSADLDTGEDGPFSGSPGIWGTVRPWFDEHQGWYVGIDEEQDVIDGVTDGKAFGGGPSIDSSDPNFNWGDDPLEGEVQDYPGFVMASQTKTSNPDGESLAGGLGDDVLRGNIGSDVLVGEGGDDELRGDAGNDELYGGPGDDKLFGEGGDDLLDGGPGFDELDGGEGQDTLRGQDDDDRLTGGAGDDRLEGGTGNDVYVYTAEGGSDTIADGGLSPEEVDVLRFTNVVSDKVIVRRTVEGGNDLTITFTDQAGTVRLIGQLQGSAGVERFDFSEGVTLTAADIAILADQDDAAPKTLTGTPGPDTLVGADGNDSLSGLDGNDLLAGGRGDDTLIGGAGNDIFTYDRIDSGFDVIDGGTGTDTLRADAADVAIGITSLTSLEAITANGFANVSILGSAGNNIFGFASVTLTGIAKIDMGAGNDNVIGSGAADTVHGGAGADTLAGGNGNDALHGDSGSDSLSGGAGDDVLDGGDGDDAFSFSGTSGGFDAVVGGIGADTVRALANGTTIGLSSLSSVEAITAGTFTGVSVLGSSAGNLLDLSAVALTGITKVDGGSGNDTITGTGVADTLLGGSGDDVIASGAGDDAVQFTGTSSGFDDVDGGAGVDTLSALANSTVIGLRSITDVEAITAGAFTNVSVAGSSLSDVLDFSGVTLTGIARIDANGGNDQITGSAAADTIMGGSGDDTLAGGDGDDTFQFTSTSGGFDAISGGAGQDTVAALANSTVIGLSSLTGVEAITAGTFTGVTISGSGNADLLDFSTVTLSGIVRAIGGTGNDTLIGNATANTLWGGFGNDIVQGGAGDDSLAGDDGNDLLVGGEGSDTLTGGAGTDTADYAGSTAALTINLGLTTAQTIAAGEVETLSTIENLVTGSGNDTLTGSTAANNLKGGAGDDRITGGAGNDSLDGGLGADVAVFAGAKSTYQIVTTAGTTTVKDNATTTDGNDGTDTLIGIETAQFKDGTQALAAPIIFDLDGDGVTGVDQGRSKAKFDWNGDGNRDKTGWLDKGDGLLVFDRNGDGKMSGADELSFVNDKPGARSDLDGLTAFDSNGDGLFSGVDEQWASFRVWVDRDTDGKVDKRELKTLADLSIASITLAGQATERTWDWGEVVTVNTGTFTRTDGTAGGFSDVVLSYAASGKRAIVTQSAGFSDVGASTDPLGATAQLGMMRYEVHLTGEIPLI